MLTLGTTCAGEPEVIKEEGIILDGPTEPNYSPSTIMEDQNGEICDDKRNLESIKQVIISYWFLVLHIIFFFLSFCLPFSFTEFCKNFIHVININI